MAADEARPRRGFLVPVIDGVWLRLILTLMVLIASVSLLAGTAATLNATTVNPGGSFATGKLILSNQVRNRNPCLSEGETVRCDALFPGVQVPGLPASAQVTIQNVGAVPAASLSLWPTACSTKNSAGGGSHGSGDLCPLTSLSIHDDSHDMCYFPVKTPGACDTALRATFSDFVSRYSESSPLALSIDHLGGGIVYTIVATIDGTAGNPYQGRVADLALTWKIVQA
jgi:hypothetical protein